MSAATIATVTKMIESLPDSAQDRVEEYVRILVDELGDETRWDRQFADTQTGLIEAARRARRQIGEGLSTSMDADSL